jgi:hypothetical protein
MADGIKDFSGYACVPGTNPPPILWEVAPETGGQAS